ncbi:hypothetical protein LEP1GSC047_1577 [Leptospira inadai serovar Lyme str. 10]|uniref:DUF7790 domain-containing protein n=2 Tax=Leptospira inadai serovar Lyme TaxID=293084 RepID=V6H7Y6_9LEPT|nr:hypothetical protein [Leptospira inadai]EQA34752.1 hypothetical protein LEP1GSC047_1577 [Leptospira inadai serovar Lyme str. 10]PNV73111.1 hypothetical protein BES34_018060 [Leptospira inadai serovar Lyme]
MQTRSPSSISAIVLFLTFQTTCSTLSRSDLTVVHALGLRESQILDSVREESFEEKNLNGRHYPASNELRIDLFKNSIKDLRGAYLGVGTDQNLTFIAWARSETAWLVDFDPVVCYINRIHLFFIKKSPTPDAYKELWERKNFGSSLRILKEEFGASSDWKWYEEAWKVAFRGKADVPTRWLELERSKEKFGWQTFLHDKNDYDYLRSMVMNGRIKIRKADLNAKGTVREISEAMSKVGLPFRVVYLSNAEEYFSYPPDFRENIISLPTDKKGILLRTIQNRAKDVYGFPDGEKYPTKFPLHYNVQPLFSFRLWMELDRRLFITQMLEYREPLEKGFSRLSISPWEVHP